MGKSIIQEERKCYFCSSERNLEEHHIFGGVANRKISEKYGLKVFLCRDCHTGKQGAQYYKERNLELKQEAQKAFVKLYGTKKWMDLIKKNYTGVWDYEPESNDP